MFLRITIIILKYVLKIFWMDIQIIVTENKLPFQGNYFIFKCGGVFFFFLAKCTKSYFFCLMRILWQFHIIHDFKIFMDCRWTEGLRSVFIVPAEFFVSVDSVYFNHNRMPSDSFIWKLEFSQLYVKILSLLRKNLI